MFLILENPKAAGFKNRGIHHLQVSLSYRPSTRMASRMRIQLAQPKNQPSSCSFIAEGGFHGIVRLLRDARSRSFL